MKFFLDALKKQESVKPEPVADVTLSPLTQPLAAPGVSDQSGLIFSEDELSDCDILEIGEQYS